MTDSADSTFKTGHVGLNVSDINRSKAFYAAIFGFEVAGESAEVGREFAMLRDDVGLVLTLWQQSDGRFETARPGLHHLSFQVASVDEVRTVEEKLRAMGVPLIYDGIVPHGDGTQSGGIFFEDPDGIRLEIFSPTGAAGRDVPTPGAPSCGFF
jgi:catechol 2,3-dioxygenase-like lactoylglutathione lyase family enzyme